MQEDKIAVIVGAVTDDTRVYDVPAMKITALRFTETARARIVKAGGECLTFDQLALIAPLGQNTVYLHLKSSLCDQSRYELDNKISYLYVTGSLKGSKELQGSRQAFWASSWCSTLSHQALCSSKG